MSDEFGEMPDMDEMARQMQEALEAAQQAMEDLPAQMEQMEDVMGALSGLMGGLPSQMADLTSAMAGFGEAHAANVQELTGEPDWKLRAEIRVGEMLHLIVRAAFDLGKTIETWESTQGGDLQSLVAGLMQGMSGEDDQPGLTGQVMDQLQMGRGMAQVEEVQVLKCSIPGAPGNAAETLRLSTEANIPLTIDGGKLSFEFAPMLTIQNRWEKANLPTFSPMGTEIMVPLTDFEEGEPFSQHFAVSGQEHKVMVDLSLTPLE